MKKPKALMAIAILVILAGIFVTIYGVSQQVLRQSANDPQLQMARDGAAVLAAGGVPASLVARGTTLIDPAKSLAPFVAVYDANGTVLESSGVVAGKPPMPPIGVFLYAREHGEHIVTWQPADGSRIAAVIEPVSGKFDGFVLAGRSLAEVEHRESRVALMSALGWLGASVIAVAALAL